MINLFLRSFIFWLYSTVSIVIGGVLCGLSIFLPLRMRFVFIKSFSHAYFAVLKFTCHIEYQVTGLENVANTKVAVVLCKHQSTFETFLLPVFFPTPAVVIKRELLWVPFFGWGMYAAKPISINRSDKRSAMNQILEQGKAILRAGRWVALFPEGTRIPYGQVGHYRLGGARLAVEAKVPVIPVAHDAGKVWPRRHFIKRPGIVHFVIGPPIETIGKTPEEVLAETKTWIETTIASLSTRH